MKKILSFVLALCLCFSAVIAVSASSQSENNKYESVFVDRLDIVDDWGEYRYEEIYYYFSDENETVPYYILALAAQSAVSDIVVTSKIGDYAISTGPYSPYKHGFHIYVPTEDKIYTLEEAYFAGIEGIDEAFLSLAGDYVSLIGDADGNKKIDIKDATWIQKYIASIKGLDYVYVFEDLRSFACDYNRDENINIKDATAIQKHIAGIPAE